jgi:predicted nucleic acid-binding protein
VRRTLLDTNIYIDWLNAGLHEDLVLGTGRLRILSAVVLMELRAGATTRRAVSAVATLSKAYASAQRLVAPQAAVYAEAGKVLSRLRQDGREVRRASLVADTLIALTARSVGAVLVTRDASDFTAIRKHVDFTLETAV